MTSQQYHTNGADGESGSIDWEKAQRATRMLLEAVGENPDRGGLKDTWERRVPATFETLTEGQQDAEKPEMRTFEAETTDLVIKTGIPVYSLCEHHILPYHGVANIAYRPNSDVVGLSKLARYVRWQSRRLTVQEGLTRDIAEGLADEVDAEAVRVEITATHLCEAMRGVETATETTTQTTIGELTENEQRRFRSAVDSHE
ncbi:GTP cyclohydrolase I [Halapricum hydrolyticum]|uniref:GTP cyclohydrolase I n=1 Tax=Halapricum hydrolyticum TaxID=2979991 RepID=A0AAE3LEV6_9EURY|nr:GTP cyclohydrolase I [Halapricum hydrolyticum]MCU4726887.1 GTP cyclohydrolase I [Halapricum hydrolyticum]